MRPILAPLIAALLIAWVTGLAFAFALSVN